MPSPSPGDLPNPGIEPVSPTLAGTFFTTEPLGKPLRIYSLGTYVVELLWKTVVVFLMAVVFKLLYMGPRENASECNLFLNRKGKSFPKCCLITYWEGSSEVTCDMNEI